jgi:hypothetical protein
MPHNGNIQQSFTTALSETKCPDKNTGSSDWIPSDPTIFRHEAPSGVAGRAFQNTTIQPDRWDKHPVDLQLRVRWNPRTTSFIQAKQAALMPPAGIRGERLGAAGRWSLRCYTRREPQPIGPRSNPKPGLDRTQIGPARPPERRAQRSQDLDTRTLVVLPYNLFSNVCVYLIDVGFNLLCQSICRF